MSEKLTRRFRRWRRKSLSFVSRPFIVLGNTWRFLRKYTSLGAARTFRRFWKFQEPDWKKAGRPSLVVPPSKISWKAYWNPIYWIVWGFAFLYAWIVSRPYKNLGPALPAVLVAGFFLLSVFLDSVQGDSWRNRQYRGILASALRAENNDVARIASLRLMASSSGDSKLRFQNALIEDARGERELAREIILDLALNQRHGPAAYWMITSEFSLENLAEWDQPKHEAFQKLMEVARRELRDDPFRNTQVLMANYLIQMGARADAMKLLAEVSSTNPEFNLMGMAMAYQSKDLELAKRFAKESKTYLEEKLKSNPSSVADRLDLAQALVVLENEQEAVRQLQSGAKILESSAPEDAEKLNNAIGGVLVSYANRLLRTRPQEETLLQRLQVINNALRLAPSNAAVVDAVVQIILECQENKANQIVQLRKAMLEGASPDAVHFIQGTIALLDGDAEAARSHLEIAKAAGMNTPGILNNLAMSFLESEENVDLEKALEFSNAAIEAMPEHPYLRDTRGRVLLKLKRFPEAIPELEYALRAPELAAGVHLQLAEAYTGMGQTSLADEHRKLSEQIEVESETPTVP